MKMDVPARASGGGRSPIVGSPMRSPIMDVEVAGGRMAASHA